MPLDLLNRTLLRSNSQVDLAKLLAVPDQIVLPPLGPKPAKLGIVQGTGFIGFTLSGVLRWLVDVRRFAGTPSLVTNSSPARGLTFELKGARFPGTGLPADFKGVLHAPGFLGTPFDLSFTLGGFKAQGIMETWLAGHLPLQSAMKLSAAICPLGAAGKLSADGDAEARFFPTWLFQIAGTNLATITGLAPDAVSDSLALKLLFPGEPSLSAHPKSRRTRLALIGTGKNWKLKPTVLDLPIGKLSAADGLFERIDIEAGEGPRCPCRRRTQIPAAHRRWQLPPHAVPRPSRR